MTKDLPPMARLVITYGLWLCFSTLGLHRLFVGRWLSGLTMLTLTAIVVLAVIFSNSTLAWLIITFGGIALSAWWLMDALLIPGMCGFNVFPREKPSPDADA